jgi:signal transduction histidine kinase
VIELSRFTFEVLRKDEHFILYRGRTTDGSSQILLRLPTSQHPALQNLKGLQRAYTLKDELDPALAVRPIEFANHWDRTVLVMEDPGGVPLDQLLGQPLDLAFSLRIAISLLSASRHLHQARQSASRVVQNGQRAGEIIKRIRSLVQKRPPQKEWVDINETITEVIAVVSSEVQRSHVSLQTELANHLPFIRGDRIQLQQVLLNLMINAVEAMSRLSGGPRQLRVNSQEVTEVTDESNDCTPPRYEALSHG